MKKRFEVGKKVRYWNATHTKQAIGEIEKLEKDSDLIHIDGEFGSSLRYKDEVELIED